MHRNDAIRQVEAELNIGFDPIDSGGLVVLDELTQERPYGWVFFLNTRRFAETRNRRDAVIGIGPVVYRKQDRSIHKLPSGIPTERAIHDFECRESLGQ